MNRAYSNYWHQVHGGKEFYSFETALKKEKKRIKKSRYHDFTYSYMRKGFYADQIERFFNLFANEQILIVRFEELKKNTQKVLNEIYEFLAVKRIKRQKNTSEIKNKSVLPGSRLVQFTARRVFGGNVLFRAIAKANLMAGRRTYPPMKGTTHEYLKELYFNDIRKLEAVSGMDFKLW